MIRRRLLFQITWLVVIVLVALVGFRAIMEAPLPEDGSQTVLALGRSLGLLAVALLLLQPILALRSSVLERMFGLDRLLAFHRLSAVLCLTFGFLHPLFIYGSKLCIAGPSGIHLWPQAMGGLALFGLWLLVVSSLYRDFLLLHWEAWRNLHVVLAMASVPALVHVFAVQPDFRRGLAPLWGILVLASWMAFVAWHKYLRPFLDRDRRKFAVVSVKTVAENVTELTLTPENAPFSYLPGQFAFLCFQSDQVGPESHPFTISSTPVGGLDLQFAIKGTGDFTRSIGALRQGDMADVSGPFGVFTPARFGELKHLVMVAGGIGITPMLSVLRTYAMEPAHVPLTLLWANQTTRGTPYLEEVETLGLAIPELSVHHFLTRDMRPDVHSGRMYLSVLRELVPSYEAGVHVMLCGPRQMRRDLARKFRDLGYPRSTVHYEDFAL